MQTLETGTIPRSLVSLLVVLGSIVGTVGCATLGIGGDDGFGDEETFQKWDDNRDGVIGPNEFTDNADWFDDYDEDDNGYISKSEFLDGPAEDWVQVGAYDTYDVDGDNRLTEGEFHTGLFKDFDTNDDGALDQSEWGI